ncbi:class E sortase [Streptomyces peucetius]|uniref:Class E sortase n=1 Tax=Streptomyces peucetius TaxID=1950 RepID=A0ABY6I631_STRPE|nr:class E sortase [Streptomyces peucetius]UYQ62301.1 class E sortase [Streptomyces peucetius]
MRRRWERQRVRARARGRVWLARGLWTAAEVAVTLGVVVLLLVVHQLWWTNRQAREGAERQVHALEQQWERGPSERAGVRETTPAPDPDPDADADPDPDPAPEREPPDEPRWDQAYAVLRIPRLDVVAPVAEGIGKRGVLDKGYVGHYPDTAQPGRAGNFAVAGHRNTHGEPFRHINRLRPGDTVEVETRQGVYVYAVDRTLARTLPGDTGVIDPVPRSSVRPAAGYDAAGHYLTMTTCTPEFSSRYRLVVWALLAAVRPR